MNSLFLLGRILFGFFFAAGLNHFLHHAAIARMVPMVAFQCLSWL